MRTLLISTVLFAAAPAAAEPWSQADAIWGAEAMARSRSALIAEHGAQRAFLVMAERLEWRSNAGDPLLLFEGRGWWGADRDKLWIKTEVEYDFAAEEFEEVEVQALWSRAIAPFFDFQGGIRRDFSEGPSRTYAVAGVQGLAPYWFEIDAQIFVSAHGEVFGRFEAEYELLLTQRLVLQPSAELDFAAQTVDELGAGAGLSTAELGLRLRYEIRREFAPYVGVSWTRAVGETADLLRADGEDPSSLSAVAGLRFWF